MTDDLIARAETLAGAGGRRILGIAGPPGAGKSTLAREVVDALGDRARLVPMDGFHLSGSELVRLGRSGRKGAPDTFDAGGFVALLARLRRPGTGPVRAPVFSRELEEPVADAVEVPPGVPLVVTEGNYLLLDQEPWDQLRGLLDEAWWVSVDDALRVRRLVDRHVAHGRSPGEARRWVAEVDEANAALVDPGRARADLVVPRPA